MKKAEKKTSFIHIYNDKIKIEKLLERNTSMINRFDSWSVISPPNMNKKKIGVRKKYNFCYFCHWEKNSIAFISFNKKKKTEFSKEQEQLKVKKKELFPRDNENWH